MNNLVCLRKAASTHQASVKRLDFSAKRFDFFFLIFLPKDKLNFRLFFSKIEFLTIAFFRIPVLIS